MAIEEDPIQVEDIADFWMECRAAGDKRWTKLAHRALHGSVDDPVTSDAWEYVAEEIIKRRRNAAQSLPLHRIAAGIPDVSTCDGGGCPDCTDPA